MVYSMVYSGTPYNDEIDLSTITCNNLHTPHKPNVKQTKQGTKEQSI